MGRQTSTRKRISCTSPQNDNTPTHPPPPPPPPTKKQQPKTHPTTRQTNKHTKNTHTKQQQQKTTTTNKQLKLKKKERKKKKKKKKKKKLKEEEETNQYRIKRSFWHTFLFCFRTHLPMSQNIYSPATLCRTLNVHQSERLPEFMSETETATTTKERMHQSGLLTRLVM